MVWLKFILVFLSYVQANGISEQKISTSLAPCIAHDWTMCSHIVAKFIDKPCVECNLFGVVSEPVIAFGGICNIDLSKGFYQWRVGCEGEFRCPHISSSLVGLSPHHESTHCALNDAIKDFIVKAGHAGVLTLHHIVSYNMGYIVTDPTSNAELTTLQLSHFLHLSCRSTLFMYVISIERHKKRHYLQQLLQQIKPQHRIQKRVLIQCWLQQHTQIQQSQQSNYSCH